MKIFFLGVISIGFVAIVTSTISIANVRTQRMAGFCNDTGQRLSNKEVLSRAYDYTVRLISNKEVEQNNLGGFSAQLVPDENLRLEEQPPDWVRYSGGYRAYVRIHYNSDTLADQGFMLIISNCGQIRYDMTEFLWRVLW